MIQVFAILIVILDIILLLRNKDNPYLLIFNFLILYFNYSICFGVYLSNENTIESYLLNYKEGELYFIGLILLLCFSIIRFILFYRKFEVSNRLHKESVFLYFVSILILVYIAIFEIDRTVSATYEVKISPLYEYSFIFVILAFFYIPNKVFHKFILYATIALLIFQDFYYGGRVTSLQILIVIALMQFQKYIKLKYIVVPFILLNLLFTTVGVYRGSYKLELNLEEIINILLGNLFISDTVVYAYFASITHLFMFEKVDAIFSIESLMSFIILIFLGGIGSSLFKLDLSNANLTDIANSYHWNVGGGVIVTYFYVWFGPYFYVLVILFFLLFLKRRMKFNTVYQYISLIIILVTMPRWYLYNPLALFRGVFFMLPAILLVYKFLDLFSKKKKILLK